MDIYVYMLRCADGSYYVGLTKAGLDKRVFGHSTGAFKGYTSNRLPVTSVWSEQFLSLKDAISCERRLKGWRRAKKEALIRGTVVRYPSCRGRRAKTLVLRQAQDEGFGFFFFFRRSG